MSFSAEEVGMEHSHLEAFLIHTWMRSKSAQGGLLQQKDEVFTEYSESERTHKNHQVQLLSERPIWGSNPQQLY